MLTHPTRGQVERELDDGFGKHSKIGNRKLLWHGALQQGEADRAPAPPCCLGLRALACLVFRQTLQQVLAPPTHTHTHTPTPTPHIPSVPLTSGLLFCPSNVARHKRCRRRCHPQVRPSDHAALRRPGRLWHLPRLRERQVCGVRRWLAGGCTAFRGHSDSIMLIHPARGRYVTAQGHTGTYPSAPHSTNKGVLKERIIIIYYF